MKKKLFSISTLLFLFLLITLNSCRQELDVIANQTNKEREAEFFSTAKNNSQTGKISTNQDLIIDILKKDNEQSHFVSKLDDKKGLPVWNSMLIQKNKNSSAKGVSGSEKTILIPLTEDGDFLSSYIVASINANNEITHLENVTNKELYEFVHNKSIPKDVRETALGNIIYTNNKVFGFKKFINIPEDLFAEIPLDKGKDTKTIKFVEKKSSSSMASRTEMELLCYSYEADDPSCSCHGTIIISKCFYVLVEYGGGGSTGDSGDSTGGSTSGGGGSSGSSSTTNNTPWYLMNPDIDIYSYNPTIKGVFKSMTDQGFVLQKEHVDFLQANTTLANTIRNICLTNNTAYKSLFVYNLLDDYAFASPTPDVNVLNNKLNLFYYKIFAINPQTNWFEFFDIFSVYENTNSTILNELSDDWSSPDRVKPTKRFKNHAKINAIYNQVKTAANFKQYLQNFEPTFSVAHLLFDIGATVDQDATAETSPPLNYWIKITFNKNKDFSNMPKVYIAYAFMHEMVHAEIFRKLLSLVPNSNGTISEDLIKQYLTSHDYPGLFDYYVRKTKGDESWQHETMAAHYVNIMVNYLKQVYGSKYTLNEYKTIVWMGLTGTRAWNLLPQSERDLYTSTWNTNYWLWEK